MFYRIQNAATNLVVYDPRLDDALVIDPELKLADNQCGSLRFTMHPDHPDYGNIQKRRTIYEVFRGDAQNPIFRGICAEGSDDQASIAEFYFEDFLSVLRDSMHDAFDYHGGLTAFFEELLEAHNAQVETWQQIQPGHVTVTDPNDYIYRASEKELTTWEIIKTRLIDVYGGHLRMRYESGVAYLDYLLGDTTTQDQYLNFSTQTIELGENLKDFSRLISASETYTACIPKGAETTFYDDDGAEYKARITIEEVNDGSKYLVNTDAVALYGWRCAPLDLTTWDDVTMPENLKTKGAAFLNGTLVKLTNSIKLTAEDLAHLGVESDTFGFLDYVRVSIYTANINQIYLLTGITIPLDDPSELTISLGITTLSLTDQQARRASDIVGQVERVESSVSEVQQQIASDIAEVSETFTRLIESTSESIMSQCASIYVSSTSFSEYQEQISTMLTQTAQGFTMQFNNLTQQITMLNGTVQTQIATTSKYIRFVDGNIVIGIEGNPLILKIGNDKISFITDNVEIAYFSSGRLYVNDVEALISLTIGNFAFVPTTTGGMSLKYIGT